MRKVVSIAAVMLALSATFAAADQGEFLLGGTAGVGIPTGDFGDLADPGFSGGVFGDYMVTPNLAVGVDALFHSFGGTEDFINTLPSAIDDITFQLLQFTAHGRWVFTPEQQAMPYVVAGGGIYNVKSQFKSSTLGDSDETSTKGGIYGGAGLDVKLNPMFRIGVEGAFHDVFTEGSSSQVITILGRLSYTFAGQSQ